MTISIHKKILLACAAMFVAGAVSAYINETSISDMIHEGEDLLAINTALRNHMEGDMMHDAIRGDMLSTLYALEMQDKAALEDVGADLKEHASHFEDMIAANKALDLPADIRAVLDDLNVPLSVYIASAQTLYQQAQTDKAAAHALYPDFKKSFSDLEEKMGAASDKIHAISESTQKTNAEHAQSVIRITLALAGLTMLMIIVVPVLVTRLLLRPLKEMMGTMQRIAAGDTGAVIPHTGRRDEMGDMARTVQVFKENAQRVVAMAEEQKAQEHAAQEMKRKTMHELAASFESSVKGVVDMVASAATEMDATAKSMANIADNNKSKLLQLNAQISSTSQNVQTVAASTTQLSASVNEINKQVARAASITSVAVDEARRADGTVQGLTDAAQKIGEVVEMINSIAAQINLLALNATIEAARAGDAGKGFAVVASEVKNLAGQTTKATEQIGQYINAIQGATENTVGVIKTIGGTISEINEIATTIAAAVEEQSVSTQDIARNVQMAADGTDVVAKNAGDVSASSSETGESANQMMAATSELSRQSEVLRREVDKFIVGIRQG